MSNGNTGAGVTSTAALAPDCGKAWAVPARFRTRTRARHPLLEQRDVLLTRHERLRWLSRLVSCGGSGRSATRGSMCVEVVSLRAQPPALRAPRGAVPRLPRRVKRYYGTR